MTFGEKIKIILSSDSLSTIQQDFKTKIDDIKGRIDINVNRAKNVAETTAKDALYIEVILPNKYIKNAELSSLCKKLITTNLTCPNLEFEGRTDEVVVDGFDGTLEINCNLDMNIQVISFKGNIEINQLNATSQLVINATQDFKKVCKGIGTAILFEENGAMVEDFSNPNSENKIELNGIKSELKLKKMNTN
ncbi:MAG: hypothetical protein K6A43_05755 [Treponema sp.]|nr:hypothetical protein [Treponema sp.]